MSYHSGKGHGFPGPIVSVSAGVGSSSDNEVVEITLCLIATFRIDGIEIHFPLQIRIGNILRNRKSKAELSVAHGVIPYKNRIRIVSEGESRTVIFIAVLQAGDSHLAVFTVG